MTVKKPVSEQEKQFRPQQGEVSPEEARSKAVLYAAIERQQVKTGKRNSGS